YHVDVRAPASPDCALLLFFPRAGHHRDLHSFPTRRSSDLDESGRRFDAAAAWPVRLDPAHVPESIAANSDLAAFLARTKWIVDLRELQKEPSVYGDINLPEWVRQRNELRIVSPLFLSNDLAGILFLSEPPAPFDLTYEDRDLLRTVGRHVATHIAQQDADKKLAENRQFEA